MNQASKLWSDSGRRQRKVAGRDVSDALWARRRWQALGLATVSTDRLLPGLTGKLQPTAAVREEIISGPWSKRNWLRWENWPTAPVMRSIIRLRIFQREAQTLLTDESDPERRRTLAIINTQAFRANEMIADMMLFARPPSLVCEPTGSGQAG